MVLALSDFTRGHGNVPGTTNEMLNEQTDLDRKMERLAKYPWLPIPPDGGVVPICCPTGKPFVDKVLLRGTILLEWLVPKKRVPAGDGKPRLAGITAIVVLMMIAFFVAVPIEVCYVILNAIGATTMRVFFWLAAVVMLFVPSVLIVLFPSAYNPLTAFLLSFAMFAMAGWASHLQSEASAVKSANQRWLPQAQSACDHLLNLCYTIKRFQQGVACSCEKLRRHVTQLDEPKNLPIKLFIEQQCESSASRFRDVANHLESAYADWERFIRHNCQDGECEAIFDSLRLLRHRLDQELAAIDTSSMNSDGPRRCANVTPSSSGSMMENGDGTRL